MTTKNNRKYNHIGQRFGRLTVIRDVGKTKGYDTIWECKCDCGKITYVGGYWLRTGYTRSCGCLRAELTRERGYQNKGKKHRRKEGDVSLTPTRGDRLYTIWCGMKTRCYNPKNRSYRWYGARGITICEEWKKSFQAFKEWSLANGYTPTLTIDRIDNDRGYAPDNCRWATLLEQRHNQRRWVEYHSHS